MPEVLSWYTKWRSSCGQHVSMHTCRHTHMVMCMATGAHAGVLQSNMPLPYQSHSKHLLSIICRSTQEGPVRTGSHRRADFTKLGYKWSAWESMKVPACTADSIQETHESQTVAGTCAHKPPVATTSTHTSCHAHTQWQASRE